jgi:aspartate aminotransferase-like enzyme
MLIAAMRARHNIAISGGLTKLAGQVIRVGHLGAQARPALMQRVVDALEASLRERAPVTR